MSCNVAQDATATRKGSDAVMAQRSLGRGHELSPGFDTVMLEKSDVRAFVGGGSFREGIGTHMHRPDSRRG